MDFSVVENIADHPVAKGILESKPTGKFMIQSVAMVALFSFLFTKDGFATGPAEGYSRSNAGSDVLVQVCIKPGGFGFTSSSRVGVVCPG